MHHNLPRVHLQYAQIALEHSLLVCIGLVVPSSQLRILLLGI
jgi:hypothetical protein